MSNGNQDEFLDLPGKNGKIMQESIETHGGKYDLLFLLPEGKHATFVHDQGMVKQVLDAWYRDRAEH